MFQPGLFLSFAAGLVAAGVFAYVGQRQRRRALAGNARVASRAFSVWWFGLATYTAAIGIASSGLALLGLTPVWLFFLLRLVSLVSICVALGGLVGYLAFLYTGNARAWSAGVLTGSALLVFLFVLIGGHRAIDVDVGVLQTRLALDPPMAQAQVDLAIAAVLVPQAVCAALLLGLYPRVADATSRWRLLLVGGGLLVWSAAELFAGYYGGEAAQVLTRPFLGALVAVATLWAYDPPTWARRRYHVGAL